MRFGPAFETALLNRFLSVSLRMRRVVAADLKAFSDFLMHRLLRLPMVAHVRSSILLDEVKSTTALPLARLG